MTSIKWKDNRHGYNVCQCFVFPLLIVIRRPMKAWLGIRCAPIFQIPFQSLLMSLVVAMLAAVNRLADRPVLTAILIRQTLLSVRWHRFRYGMSLKKTNNVTILICVSIIYFEFPIIRLNNIWAEIVFGDRFPEQSLAYELGPNLIQFKRRAK